MGQETPAIIIHNFLQGQAALAAAHQLQKSIVLWSAPGAGCYAGAGWWQGLLDLLQHARPEPNPYASILDCGDAPGFVLAAIRARVPGIYFCGMPDIAHKLSQMATARGLGLITVRPAALDLAAVKNPQEVCQAYLSNGQHGVA